MGEKMLRAAIIGLGFIGGADQVSGDALGQNVTDLDGTHAAALLNHPAVDLVTGSSRDLGRRQRFTERTGVQTYDNWREMLATESSKSEPLDIVSIATYTPVHAEITIACAEHGVRAVYCEKPIAATLTEADRMVQRCEDAGTLLVINHNRRFNPNLRRLRDLIAAGGLGNLSSAMLQWSSGRLGNVGTHTFDAISMLTGQSIAAVSGTLDLAGRPDCRGQQFQDPGGWGLLKMSNGLRIFVDAPDYAAVPLQIVINGEKGRAAVNGDAVTIDYWHGEQEQWPGVNDGLSSMDRAVDEIVRSLNDNEPFTYPAKEAVNTLEAIVGFHVSHANNGAWTDLPLSGTDREFYLRTG